VRCGAICSSVHGVSIRSTVSFPITSAATITGSATITSTCSGFVNGSSGGRSFTIEPMRSQARPSLLQFALHERWPKLLLCQPKVMRTTSQP
jgi:hypothetical protein